MQGVFNSALHWRPAILTLMCGLHLEAREIERKTDGKTNKKNSTSPPPNILIGIKLWQSSNIAENLLFSYNAFQTGPFCHYWNS